MKQTTFQRAREENRMRAAIVNGPRLGAQGLTPEQVASLMQRGIIGIRPSLTPRVYKSKYATVQERKAAQAAAKNRWREKHRKLKAT